MNTAAAPAPTDRHTAILSLRRNVERAAAQAKRSCPITVDVRDLVQEGWLGAMKAVDRFDPEKGRLNTFADYKIQGRIRDYQRAVDPLSRRERAEVKAGKEEPVRFGELHDQIPERRRPNTVANLILADLLAKAGLAPREKRILHEYYFEGLPMKEIGRGLGIIESRVSQIHARALLKLRTC